MEKMILTLGIVLLTACATQSPQQMNGRELAKCAWKGNADCKTELQHRMQMRQAGTTPTNGHQVSTDSAL